MWTPNSPGAYAGTCIFLVLLAVIFRSLLAVKAWKERAWLDAEFNRPCARSYGYCDCWCGLSSHVGNHDHECRILHVSSRRNILGQSRAGTIRCERALAIAT